MPRKKKQNKRANNTGGLTERTYKRTDGSTYTRWQAEVVIGYYDNGKPQRKTVYGNTQAEAIEKMQALQQQLNAGTFADTDMSMKIFIEQWLKEKAREVKPQTVEDYRYQLEHYVVPKIGRVKLAKLKPMHIQSMCGELADEISPQRANKCRRVLSGALKQAVRWELIPRNPCDAVKPMKVEKSDIVVWTSEEATHFLKVAYAHRLYAIFYLAMSTGMRRGELLGLRWQDIEGFDLYVRQNLIDQRGKIMFSTPKTKKGYRRLDISDDVIEVLEQHRQRQQAERQALGLMWPDNDLVFPSQRGTPMHPRNLMRAWYDLQAKTREAWCEELQEAGREQELERLEHGELLPHARLHDLRHLHASVLILVEKKSVLEVADRLGHTNPSFTLDTYAHLFDQQRERNPVSIMNYLSQERILPTN